jgi:hypothetical protein
MGSSVGLLVDSLEESLVGLVRWVGLSLRLGELGGRVEESAKGCVTGGFIDGGV